MGHSRRGHVLLRKPRLRNVRLQLLRARASCARGVAARRWPHCIERAAKLLFFCSSRPFVLFQHRPSQRESFHCLTSKTSSSVVRVWWSWTTCFCLPHLTATVTCDGISLLRTACEQSHISKDRGNAQCWDGAYNYDRCCFPKEEL